MNLVAGAPKLTCSRTFPEDGLNAVKTPLPFMVHTAPAATIVGPDSPLLVHATLSVLLPARTATSESSHATNTIEPCTAGWPNAREQTCFEATSPPTWPSLFRSSRYTIPALPAANARAPDSSTGPTEPRSISPAFSAAQSVGAK